MLMFIHQQQLQYQQAHVTRVSVNRSSRQNEERWKLLSADFHAEHCHITVPVSSPIAFAPSRDHCAVNTDAWYKFSSSLNTRDGDGAKYIFFQPLSQIFKGIVRRWILLLSLHLWILRFMNITEVAYSRTDTGNLLTRDSFKILSPRGIYTTFLKAFRDFFLEWGTGQLQYMSQLVAHMCCIC